MAPALLCVSPDPEVVPTAVGPGTGFLCGPESWRFLSSLGGMFPQQFLFLLLLRMEEKHADDDVLLPCLEIPRKGHKSTMLAQEQRASAAGKCRRSWKMRLNHQWDKSLLLQSRCAWRDSLQSLSNLWQGKDTALHKAQMLLRPWALNWFLWMMLGV